ncbi:MAG: WD40/YVTN/BNR-like repeat-containing protein, partial [Vicinamibacterales bacterium]
GIYKSTDAGNTWTHLGLRDGQQITQIVVDPHNPDRLFIAVLGHPYAPNDERGVFRSTDGGRRFEKVLYKDAYTGAADLVMDPSHSDHLYAVLWQQQLAPWENGVFTGSNSGLFESNDAGGTWHPLTKGLPTYADGLGRIGITIAPSNPRRMYATVQVHDDGWLYRSDDGGQSWSKATENPHVAERPDDFAEVKVDPANPDIVYTASIVTWKSVDGGKTFKALRGAPGGDDYHRLWINPRDPNTILLASDQGAVVTVNGGETWSSWYNQPTAQFYHAIADNAFPYRVCGGQQESGSACVASRGDDGRITFRDWHPVAAEEYAYIAPDPLNPDIVYGGRVTRYNRKTGDVVNVGPKQLGSPDYRLLRTAPLLFSPIDPHVLYFASNVLWKTASCGAEGWTQISPDLTRKTWTDPPNVGAYAGTPEGKPTDRGVIYTIAPSHTDVNRIWIGTDDGLIQVTSDGGKTWKDVTPPAVKPWAKISMMDASHTDALGAYAAVNTIRLDDMRPHIYRTHDGGKTWTEIVAGLPNNEPVNTVKEDPKEKRLLFAGTETQVYVSFDDGDHWQSLKVNMPATSIRDLYIKDDDLLAGTHGRGFWILDDITALRQWTAAQTMGPAADAYLFKPETATRVDFDKNTDTPLPADEPAGQNPPDGAIIDYYLKGPAQGVVTLDVLDRAGKVVRAYKGDEVAPPIADEDNTPAYWIRPVRVLSAAAGLHRFVWDLHYSPPAGHPKSYSIAATPHDTAADPRGPWVVPGTYTVRLTVSGSTFSRPLTVRMDPRIKTNALALQQQFALARRVYDAMNALQRRIANAPDADAKSRAQKIDDEIFALYPLTQENSGPPPPQNVRAIEAALARAGLASAPSR